MTSFTDLGLRGPLAAVLDTQGIAEPFPIQALTLPDALAGRDVCGKAKTGSGKTLAFSLPLIERLEPADPRPRRALSRSPTRELALQVTEVMARLPEARGHPPAASYAGPALGRQIKALAAGVEVVIATPGRLIDLIDRKELVLTALEMVVLDEADRMADMGFLPQVEWVLRRARTERQTMLFSATLDGAVDHVVRRHLSEPVFHEVESTSMTVDDMVHRFLFVHEMDKVKVAAAIAGGVDRCLVFVRTKRGADRVAAQLTKEGVQAQPIHGDLRQRARERARLSTAFIRYAWGWEREASDLRWSVATTASDTRSAASCGPTRDAANLISGPRTCS